MEGIAGEVKSYVDANDVIDATFFCTAEENPVPTRLHRDPLGTLEDLAVTPEQQTDLAKYKASYRLQLADPVLAELMCLYYIDGLRPLGEVAALAALACPGSSEVALQAYVQLLAALGVVELKTGGVSDVG